MEPTIHSGWWHGFGSFGFAYGAGARLRNLVLRQTKEHQDERKRELLLDDNVEAQRRDFRV